MWPAYIYNLLFVQCLATRSTCPNHQSVPLLAFLRKHELLPLFLDFYICSTVKHGFYNAYASRISFGQYSVYLISSFLYQVHTVYMINIEQVLSLNFAVTCLVNISITNFEVIQICQELFPDNVPREVGEPGHRAGDPSTPFAQLVRRKFGR